MQLNKILDRSEADMWSQIRTVFDTAVDSAQEKLESYLKGPWHVIIELFVHC